MRLIDANTLKGEFTGNFNGGYYTVPEIHAVIATAPTIGGWISVEDKLPDKPGWYMAYAPTYRGGSSTSRENHEGVMFAKWSGKNWSVERCYYNRPGCVEKWMPLPTPEPPKEET